MSDSDLYCETLHDTQSHTIFTDIIIDLGFSRRRRQKTKRLEWGIFVDLLTSMNPDLIVVFFYRC